MPARHTRIHVDVLKRRLQLPRTKSERADGRIDTIGRDEFIQQTKSIWSFSTESARRVNHPAPFPIELPKRCIEMFTFLGDVVFDPFLGSGTTAVAAKQAGEAIRCDI